MAQQNTTPGGALNVVGRRGPNIDALERVTGRAKYTGDIDIPGMLVGRVLRSTRPHARISRIDTSKAEAVPGLYRLSIVHPPWLPIQKRKRPEPVWLRDAIPGSPPPGLPARRTLAGSGRRRNIPKVTAK